jgi:thiamine phosphate synthase YjbQ (UPF0047 family)
MAVSGGIFPASPQPQAAGSGRLLLGTWQGITLFEHRRRPRDREIALHLLGE